MQARWLPAVFIVLMSCAGSGRDGHAFVSDSEGGMVDLDSLPNGFDAGVDSGPDEMSGPDSAAAADPLIDVNEDDRCPVGFSFIAAGEFDMGTPAGQPGHPKAEVLHHVVLTHSFCMKVTELTQGEWTGLMGNNPSASTACGDACPVEQVSWWDAIAYCNAMSARDGLQQCYSLTGCTGTPGVIYPQFYCTCVGLSGLDCPGYRLPTEAEWEYAARAGTTTATYNGTIDADHLLGCADGPNPILDPIAWYCANSDLSPHPVMTKKPNAWGLYDMLGNVWEYCWDGFGQGRYSAESVTDPVGESQASALIAKGGAFSDWPDSLRAATYSGSDPKGRDQRNGFRVVLAPR